MTCVGSRATSRARLPAALGGGLMPIKLVIEGGRPLRGEVATSAAKNAALPALAAALLTAEPVILENVPALADVRTMRALLEKLGGETADAADGSTRIRVPQVTSPEAPYELVSTMRASVLVLGPLVARAGVARVALPGGCAIGVRPIDQHLKGLARLGAEIAIENGYVEARASRLKGARITTDLVTVTGTENLMMAAALAEGTTVIENAAREPEVADLARLLSAMGARIEGAGTERIEIEGVPELGGARHRIIPDRIEAGTLLAAAAITGGDITVTGARSAASRRDPGEAGGVRRRHRGGRRSRALPGRRRGRAPPTSSRARIPASPPTCRRSSWRCWGWPTASRASRRPSSRTATCTRPSSAAWARASAPTAPPP